MPDYQIILSNKFKPKEADLLFTIRDITQDILFKSLGKVPMPRDTTVTIKTVDELNNKPRLTLVKRGV